MAQKKKRKKHPIFWTFMTIQILIIVALLGAIAYYYLAGYAKKL